MHKQRLSSIPEIEMEEDLGRKWVPKKKHEVLKAKYKCLKKLFQIYDASVIGILPEPNPESVDETKANRRRRKRSHRTKTDACAGTNETSSGDNTIDDYENTSVATAIIRDLHIDSCISTQIDNKIDKYAETIDTNSLSQHSNDGTVTNFTQQDKNGEGIKEEEKKDDIPPHTCNCYPHPFPCSTLNEKRKLTRFQCFVQRLFGIRRDCYGFPNGHNMYAVSDPTLTCREKRRRRGMRFRRLRRPQKIKSDSALRDMKSPSILSYVQSVQRSCLMDMTPRQCPILGCKMISYGIINYNDHLNICHFKDRKFFCHYCHEGFEREIDKFLHENEHIGITKLSLDMSTLSPAQQTCNNASNTQTEPEMKIPEDKLKKIVSFFDKFSDPSQLFSDVKKNQSSETNMTSKVEMDSGSESETTKTRTNSFCHVRRRTNNLLLSSADSDASSQRFVPLVCHFCGENFRYRRQLVLHEDLEHRVHEKFSKYHSCAGLVTRPAATSRRDTTESAKRVDTSTTLTENSSGRRKSEVTCDSSSNIVYYTSTESLRKPSVVDSFVKKVRAYRWEPGTKIIRV